MQIRGRFRRVAAVALTFALLPIASLAVADETTTAVELPSEASVIAPAPLSAVDLAASAQTLRIVSTRARNKAITSQSAVVALDPTGTTFWQSRATTPMLPASTMKLVTAVVALDVLGADWRPRTTVVHDASTGTLTLVGGGDAMLTTAKLATLAQATAAALTGAGATVQQLTIDDSLYPTPTLAPGVSAGLQPSEVRPIRALVVDRRSTSDVATTAGRVFQRELATAGITVSYKGRSRANGDEIASVKGLPLSSVLRTMLWYSDNDIAEMTFRNSAYGATTDASWESARATAREHLAALGIRLTGAQLVDGSGLSRNNRLTATQLATLLRVAQERPQLKILASLLPAAGENGTLRSRYHKAPSMCVRAKLVAKTGGLHDVVALAGYAPTPGGAVRPFAIIVNSVRSISAGNLARHAIDDLAAGFSGC